MVRRKFQPTEAGFQSIENINSVFTFVRELQRGAFGIVYKVQRISDDKFFALKSIQLKNEDKEEPAIQREIAAIQREIDIMARLVHTNIVKFEAAYVQDKLERIIVMELCTGGELWEYCRGRLSEQYVKQIMNQLLSALNYCHQEKIAHLDVKLENVMLYEPWTMGSNDPCIKLVDFGHSCTFDAFEQKPKGTPEYMAPEVLLQEYNEKADLWSAGCTMFMMLASYEPFGRWDEIRKQLVSNILYNPPADLPENDISNKCRALVNNLLTKDMNTRISAADALKDAWFADECDEPVRKKSKTATTQENKPANTPDSGLGLYTVKKLKRFVDNLPDEQKADVARMLWTRGPEMSVVETRDCILAHVKKEDQPIDQLQKLDLNANDMMNTNQFLCAMVAPRYMSRETYNCFFLESVLGNGLTLSSLKRFFVRECQAEQVFADLDKNREATISSEEFVGWCIQDLTN